MLVALALAACQPQVAPTLDAVSGVARTRVVNLTMGPVVPGGTVSIGVSVLAPGEEAYLALSLRGPGAGPCPPSLGGACLGLARARFVGSATPDLSGQARIELAVPAPVLPGDRVWAQAVVVDAAGEVLLGPIVEREVVEPAAFWPGDLVLEVPGDLSAARDLVAVEGDVVVEGTGLEEVELLSLREVGGELRVWENDVLELLRAPELRFVGGAVSLYDDPLVSTLEGLPLLEEVGGTLSVNRMEGLTGLDLPSLRQAGALYLFHDLQLVEVSGLSALEQVGGPAELWELYALERLELPALVRVQGGLDVFEADALVDVSFPELEALGGYELHECDALVSAGDFPQLVRIDNALRLQYCDVLHTVEGLSALVTAGSVRAEALPLGDGLQLPALATVTSGIELRVTEVEEVGLGALHDAGGVDVRGNALLYDLGMESLVTVGSVRLQHNELLSHCDVEDWLAGVAFDLVSCLDNLDDGCASTCEVSP